VHTRRAGIEIEIRRQVELAELRRVGFLRDVAAPECAVAGAREAGLPPRAPAGTEMPFVPRVQATAIARQSLDFGQWPGYLQAALSYTDDSWSRLDVNERRKQSAYTIVNLAAGIDSDEWHLDQFIDNATDERAQIVRYHADYFDPFGEITQDSATGINRPRTIGIRYGRRF